MATELKSPQQQLYDAVFLLSYNLKYSTYDYLPGDNTDYPFVFVGEYFNTDKKNKSIKYGNMVQTIHVYGTNRQRRQITTMIDHLKAECEKLTRTENFYITCKSTNDQVMPDNSTSQPLLHGILEVEFRIQ